jgi:hypothetical protein
VAGRRGHDDWLPGKPKDPGFEEVAGEHLEDGAVVELEGRVEMGTAPLGRCSDDCPPDKPGHMNVRVVFERADSEDLPSENAPRGS